MFQRNFSSYVHHFFVKFVETFVFSIVKKSIKNDTFHRVAFKLLASKGQKRVSLKF